MYTESARQVLNPQTDIHFSIRTSFTNTKFPHIHDFYEFFLLLEGSQEYLSQDKSCPLSAGALVLVRPGEKHSRRYTEPGCHINVAFSQDVAKALFSYLGAGFPQEALLDLESVPYALLTESEIMVWKDRLEELGALGASGAETIRTKLRIILLELFVNYFVGYVPARQSKTCGWFEKLLQQMNAKENFTAGVPRMLELSGKSNEHLCRTFRQIKDCTPTDYVNRLRIHFAANLLAVSDYDIVTICFDSGFDGLSYFYHLFRQEFGCPPGKYRKLHSP